MVHDDNQTQTRTEGPTPKGGAYAIAYWRDASGRPATQAEAVSVEIVEYNARNEAIHRTYGRVGKQPKDLENID